MAQFFFGVSVVTLAEDLVLGAFPIRAREEQGDPAAEGRDLVVVVDLSLLLTPSTSSTLNFRPA